MPLDAATEAPPTGQPADPDSSAAAEGAATVAPSRRGRGRQARSRRPAPAEAAAEQPVAVAAEAPEPQPAEAEAAREPEPQLLPSQTTLRTPRRRRGGRGERGDRGEQQTAWAEQARAAPAPQRPDFRQPQQPQRRPETVESLIARQNVLFEEFASQQTQALREMQRMVSNLGRGVAGAGVGIALPKVGVFLDVPNLIYAAEQVGARIHFGRLLSYLTEGRQLVRATAYAPITDDPMTRFETQRFVAPVINQGWKVVTKPWKRFADGSMKANFDIELAVDILTMSDRLDIVVLLSGDGDFRRVCELVESKGVRVEVVAFAASTAMELRSVADSYTDLGSILKEVGY